jgi:hypothetical protein
MARANPTCVVTAKATIRRSFRRRLWQSRTVMSSCVGSMARRTWTHSCSASSLRFRLHRVCHRFGALVRPSASGDDDRRCQSVRDPRVQLRQVNAKRTFPPRADEIPRAEFAITQHAFDLCLWLAATRTLMHDRWRRDLGTRHDRPPVVNGIKRHEGAASRSPKCGCSGALRVFS